MKWTLVPGFKGFYRVSSTGRVQSCRKHGGRVAGLKGPWRDMTLTEDSYGYLVVGLVNPAGRQVMRKVHQLVLLSFVGPCPLGKLCRHYPDQNPKNNNLDNLSWATPKRNQKDRIENGTAGVDHLKGENHPLSKLTEQDVVRIKKRLRFRDSQSKIAKDFGLCQSSVSRIKNGKSWAHVSCA